jgi:hypothetical protein
VSRADREDLTPQLSAVGDAAFDLTMALADLAAKVKDATKAVAATERNPSRPGNVTAALGEVQGAASAVRRAEETYDLAVLDLRTAQGEDA